MARLSSRRMSSTSPDSFKSLLCRSGGAAAKASSSSCAQPNSPTLVIRWSPLQANCRTHRPQKLEMLDFSMYQSGIDFKCPY
jgi:hypothetical protein